MPDMDGIEFLEKLIERRYAGKLMLISGMDPETLTLAREIADASAMDFLGAFVKPVSRETLAYALKVS
jgi:response regulator of citrate/malate metabolism